MGSMVLLQPEETLPEPLKGFPMRLGVTVYTAVASDVWDVFENKAEYCYCLDETELEGVFMARRTTRRVAETPPKRVRSAKKKAAPEESFDKETVRPLYMQLCGQGRKKAAVADATDTLARVENAVREARRRFVAYVRDYEAAFERVVAARAMPENLEHLGAEFDQLCSNPDVERIDVDTHYGRRRLVVHTGQIDIQAVDSLEDVADEVGTVYRIGKFKIEIYEDGDLRMWNLSHRRGPPHLNTAGPFPEAKQHPHVNSDGEPCLGNLKEVLPQIISERKYAAAVTVTIQFLKSYLPGHYGQLCEWPKSPKQPKEKKD